MQCERTLIISVANAFQEVSIYDDIFGIVGPLIGTTVNGEITIDMLTLTSLAFWIDFPSTVAGYNADVELTETFDLGGFSVKKAGYGFMDGSWIPLVPLQASGGTKNGTKAIPAMTQIYCGVSGGSTGAPTFDSMFVKITYPP